MLADPVVCCFLCQKMLEKNHYLFYSNLGKSDHRFYEFSKFTELGPTQTQRSHYDSHLCETLLCETIGKPMVLRPCHDKVIDGQAIYSSLTFRRLRFGPLLSKVPGK